MSNISRDCGCGWGELCYAYGSPLLRCECHEDNVTRHPRRVRPVGAADAADDTGVMHGPYSAAQASR
jgi:hypothetical protein